MVGAAESTTYNALVFDIETIADLTPDNRDAIAALAKERNVTPEEYGALCPPLARVVCIAWFDLAAQKLAAGFDATLCRDEPPRSVAVDNGSGAARTVVDCDVQACTGEAQLLAEFGKVVERHLQQANSRLVTFNGRGFDLPVLVHRSIKHRVTQGRELLSTAATENRYRPLLHLDLMDVVTFSGASPRWPMAAYAIGYGFRSPKNDLSGSQVSAAVQAGRIVDVVRYCAGDVIATAHIYQRLEAVPRP
jgi:hypothetical protein